MDYYIKERLCQIQAQIQFDGLEHMFCLTCIHPLAGLWIEGMID